MIISNFADLSECVDTNGLVLCVSARKLKKFGWFKDYYELFEKFLIDTPTEFLSAALMFHLGFCNPFVSGFSHNQVAATIFV